MCSPHLGWGFPPAARGAVYATPIVCYTDEGGSLRGLDAMLEFCDQPYRFFPARHNTLVRRSASWVNRRMALPGPNHRIRGVHLYGADLLPARSARRDLRLLFLPNHPSHSDPQILTEAQRRLGTPSSYMAAYDVFLRSRILAWVMQRCGAFSVDRDAADQRAFQESERVLRGGASALTIFPEGNVYLMNDRVTPFLEGAAHLALRVQQALRESGARLLAVPVAIKLTYAEDVAADVRQRLDRLAGDLGIAPSSEPLLLPAEIRRVALFALRKNLRQRGYPAPEMPGPGEANASLPGILRDAALPVIAGLEQKMELEPRPRHDAEERIRRIRRVVHQIRADPARRIDHAAALHWNDEAVLALRLLSYSGTYLLHPSLDRCAETVEKLCEDLYRHRLRPLGWREAHVEICPPIDLAEFLGAGERPGRHAARDLTARVEHAVQEGISRRAAGLQTAGSRMA